MKTVNLNENMSYDDIRASKDKDLMDRYAELKLDQLNWSLSDGDIGEKTLKMVKGCGNLAEICWRMVQAHQAKGMFEGLDMGGEEYYKIWYSYFKSILDKT